MRCPVCSGDPPLFKRQVELTRMIETTFWFPVTALGPMPEGMPQNDFDGVSGAAIAAIYVEKRNRGAKLIAHFCLEKRDLIFTLKSRMPRTGSDRDSLFRFMKDVLRAEETRGRKRKHSIDDVRAVLRRVPKASIRRIALELDTSREAVRRLIEADGGTLSQLQREVKESRDYTDKHSGTK